MNLHARGQRLLNRVTNSTAGTGVSVTYTRGATSAALTATATREAQDTVSVPTPGSRIDDKERDYLIVYADLVSAGFGDPAIGDRITETINGSSVTWELHKQPTGPAWVWEDAQRTRVRVHTRRKG